MDIRYIKTVDLFGRFNHTVKFSDGVNIIIGDNGVGKTVFLRIINSIFNGEFSYLFDLDFKEIIISFGKEIWTISRNEITETNDTSLFDDSLDSVKIQLKIQSNLNNEVHYINEDDVRINMPPYFERVSNHEWLDKRRGVFIDEKDLLDNYNYRPRTLTRGLPIWMRKRLIAVSVRMIDTQRIYRKDGAGPKSEIGRTISKYVKDISILINEEHNKAGIIASQLDRSFPSRLIEQLSAHNDITPEATVKKLVIVDEMNRSLQSVGLSDNKKESILKRLPNIDTPILTVLSLYADDMKKKLEAYSGIQGKLELFLSIINSRFDYKKCMLNKKGEFVFVTESRMGSINQMKEIKPTDLSSGEQNEFVLFYDLLFNSNEKKLVLIDEPELSLHIKWQQKMIADLIQICKYNGLNVLIATHSPDLIGNHWSLVQKLI